MLNGFETPVTSKWNFMHWALWVRKEQGVSTCSNHNEGFHAGVNKNSSSNCNFVSLLSNLMKSIMNHVTNISDNHGTSLKLKCNKRKDNLISKLKNPQFKLDDFCKTTCDCGKGEFLSNLYGTEVLCEHMIFSPHIEIMESLQSSEVTITQIILMILTKDKEIKHKTFETRINEIISHILTRYSFDDEKETTLREFVIEILNCFNLDPGEGIDFEIDYNFQQLSIEKSSCNLKFKKTKNTNDFDQNKKPKIKINQDDNEFWFSNIDSEVKIKATKLKYETLREIEYVYPEIKNGIVAFHICDFNFRKYFYQRDDDEIRENFPFFKNRLLEGC